MLEDVLYLLLLEESTHVSDLRPVDLADRREDADSSVPRYFVDGVCDQDDGLPQLFEECRAVDLLDLV